ncbi:MAG: YjdF family protein [Butyricicoccus sp.]|mgnify:FL=1
MDKVIGRLTVFFEDPFWVGVFERIENGRLSAAKVTFGAEPKGPELLIYLLRHYYRLQFSPAVETAVKPAHRNPKRAQREAGRQTAQVGIGTKSQQALQLQQEQNKQVRKRRSRARKQADAKRLYALKQQQKREKHKGH